MTKLEFVNKFFFQWFFIRLTRCQQKIITDFKMFEGSIIGPGQFGVGGNCKYSIKQWYSIQGWIVPLTGWGGDFKFIGNGWMKSITKERMNENV